MNLVKKKQDGMYTSSKYETSQDLTFLRDMIENKNTSPESIDYQFLQKELYKRRPQPTKQQKGIELIEPQTKPPTRRPNYIKSTYSSSQTKHEFYNRPKSYIKEITYTFPNTNTQSETKNERSVEIDNSDMTQSHPIPQTIDNQKSPQLITNTPTKCAERNGPKQPKSYLSWKFIGDTKDGNFGILTGKIDARETPTTLRRNFANIPYVLDRYHIEFEAADNDPKPKVHPRDLFALSIAKDRPADIRNARTISRLQQEKRKRPFYDYQYEQDTQIYLETDEKLIPLVASRLPKGTQV